MEITILLLAGVVVGLTEVIKPLVKDIRLVPIIAIVIGVLITILGGELVNVRGFRQQILIGIVLGLSAMGLYSGTKTVVKNEE